MDMSNLRKFIIALTNTCLILGMSQVAHAADTTDSSGYAHRKVFNPQPRPHDNHLLGAPVFIGGTPVVTSPYLGISSSYDASDLLINIPYINEDLSLLKQQQKIFSYCRKSTINLTDPLVILSGKIEAQIAASNHFHTFHNDANYDIDLTGAELDTAVLVNSWSTGYLAFVYDNSQGGFNRRLDNSNLLLDRGFLTFGNLDQSPIYVTLGQYYIPFGQYSSAMLTDPLTKLMGRTKARALTLGYFKKIQQSSINASVYAFNGDTRTRNDDRRRSGGVNINYGYAKNDWAVDLISGYITNITDAGGMQHNGLDSNDGFFSGFSGTHQSEMVSAIPAFHLRGKLNLNQFTLIAAYLTAARSFSKDTLSFNGQGAQPKAFHTELDYNFPIFTKPSLIGVGYDESSRALALAIPKKQYTAIFTTSVWKDTIESLEFCHAVDYATTDLANGIGGVIPIQGTGRSSNTVTFQVGFYF
jgi:hypothetical protein